MLEDVAALESAFYMIPGMTMCASACWSVHADDSLCEEWSGFKSNIL